MPLSHVVLYMLGSLIFAFLAGILVWALVEWGDLSMNEIMFTLTSPLEGTSNSVWLEVATWCLPVLTVVLVAYAVICLRAKGKVRTVATRVAFGLTALAFVIATVISWRNFKVGNYLKRMVNSSTFVEDNYADPQTTTVTFPEEKRNLIYIYLESMEITFADQASGGAFEDNIIPNLTQLAMENTTFSGGSGQLNGAQALYDTTWTMAGMFAQTAGLPLSTGIGTNDMEFQTSFASGVTSLGEILEQNGYHNVFLLGSLASFGGRELYFTSHGNYTIYDFAYSRAVGEVPENYHVWWGYEDAKLFEFAKQHVTELASADEPFNLTILTVDTHREDGYVCADCPTTFGDNQYANVLACSDKRTYDFVRWLQEQPFYENTTIILCGDHTTMDSDFCKDVPESYVRRTYTTIINAPIDPVTSEERVYSTMDLFPTTLAALGAQIEGDRLGLGTNLYSTQPTLLEQHGTDEVNEELMNHSTLLEHLLSVDTGLKPTIKTQPAGERGGAYKVTMEATFDETNVDHVEFRVYKADGDRSHIDTFVCEKTGENTYSANVLVRNLTDGPGEYVIQAALVYKDGTSQGMQQSVKETFK